MAELQQQIAVFDDWKKVVGLPAEFPALQPLNSIDLDKAKKFYVSPTQQNLLSKNILHGVGGFRSPLVVLMRRGHGISTLFDFVSQQVWNESLTRRIIPLSLDLKELRESSSETDENLRRQIAENLCNIPESRDHDWSIAGAEYARLIGAKDGLTYAQTKMQRVGIIGSLKGVGRDDLGKLAPRLDAPIEFLIKDCIETLGIRVPVLIDTSSDNFTQQERETAVRNMIGQVKKMEGSGVQEVYFADQQTLKVLTNEWSRKYEIIEMPFYRPLDIFAILTRHYPATDSRAHLAALVDPEFLLIPGVYSPDMSVNEIVSKFTEQLRITAISGSYRLSLTPNQRQLVDSTRQ